MVDRTDEVQSRLAALRAAYIAKLHDKVRQIENLWSLIQANQGFEENLLSMQGLVSPLAGSGATFGFNGLSDAAQNLNRMLQTIAENAIVGDTERRLIGELLQMVRQAIEHPDLPQPLSKLLAPTVTLSPERRLIFLVAGEPDLAADLAKQIGHFGYIVQIFSQEDDLVASAAATPPAAIVIDTDLPHCNHNSAHMMKAIQQHRNEPIPVLFISAHDDLISRLNAVRIGGLAYLTKPIDIGSLVDQLDVLTNARVNEPYRILIVEDSRQLARYYTVILEQANMVTRTVTNPLEIMEPLNEFHPDLILMDVYMPGCSGLELARVIRQQETFLSTPIVFLSAETDVGRQLQAMSLGGDDFLTKPIKPDHLVSAVASRAERSRILRSFMIRDSLTGLLNHTATKEQLDRELARAARNGSSLALAMIDIDRFKLINDSYGHPSGDQVLKSLARLLRQRMRKSDIVGRYGGEEFAVILPDTDGLTALQVLETIREGFSQLRQSSGQQTFRVSFSCGIAAFPDYNDPSTLLDAADRMLYEAKSSGRNEVRLAAGKGGVVIPSLSSQPHTF